MGETRSKKRQRDSEGAPAAVEDVAERAANPPSKKARVDTNRSLFVRSLPTNATAEALTEYFSQHYPVKHATVVLDPKSKISRGYGFVTFTDPDDAVEAKEKLNGKVLGGRKLRLDIAQPRQREGQKTKTPGQAKLAEEKAKREEYLIESRKAPKLIIRNLPWSIKTSQQLEDLVKKYGKVRFADLPNDHGKLSGFGFVTLRARKNAENAMAALNGTVVDGRTIAVDWAVDKETWGQQQGPAEPKEAKDSSAKKSSKSKKARDAEEVPEEEDDDDEDDKDEKPLTEEEQDLANFFMNRNENLEDEDDLSEEDTEDEEDDKAEGDDGEGEVSDDDEDEDEELEGEVEGEFEDDDSDSEGGADVETEAPKKKITDNSSTLFIRNLPYTATDESLKAHFSAFGPVRYARVVMDRTMDRPAGTAFVCFFNVEDSQTCLKAAPRSRIDPTLGKHSVLQDETVDPDGKYTLDGRILQVTQAVNKEEASHLEATGLRGRNKQDTDKRKLFLLNEGTISSSSPLYAKLAPTEIQMRDASEKQRKKMIQSNPSLHLSLTRLALRNIPRNMTSKELKALAREAIVGFAKDVREGRRLPISKEENARGGAESKEAEKRRREKKKGIVTQAKIVFESKEGTKINESVAVGKSRGYGFIEYSSHRWALMGLRYLNAHPLKNEAGKTQRLIVEFAIENANVVQRRKTMEDKYKLNPGPKPKSFTNRNQKEGKGKWADKKGKGGGGKPEKGGRDGKPAQQQQQQQQGRGDSKPESSGGAPPSKAVKKDADAKLALRTKIIVRKRALRKKKEGSRK
ncbi:hypothetical protein B0T17DRAFT_556081 [Bombardia bombarda]|uniref:RRM domain-containing protein n=1 Tax=Bombardia bombarda TaxID=252184 RepID=A0AA39X9M7_9PEZI|nr:hypothetical protein B0T17DRAFT_556081 [Bombardia bombarda]